METLTRRSFLVASASSAGGLLIAFHLPADARPLPFDTASVGAKEVNAWLAIEPDGTVVIRCAQAEMGEGVFTSLPMFIAEELDVAWDQVRVEYASSTRNLLENNVYGRMTTVGSNAVRGSRERLQLAGATARERLKAAAAQQWKVDRATCRTERGVVHHDATNQSATYGELAARAASIKDVGEIKIKDPSQYTLVGTPMKRIDTRSKVDGTAQFGIDVRLPGMLFAAVAHCPVFGGSPKSFDFDAIKSRPGVRQAVSLPAGVAVVAKTFWQAHQAAKALPIEWNIDESARTASTAQWLKDFTAALDGAGKDAEKIGDAQAAFDSAATKVEADYYAPWLAHACMEPLNCTAHVQPGRVDLYLGTQSPDGILAPIAKLAGVEPKNVFVHNCFLGGGFGRRSPPDFASEAVLISKAVNAPVQMIWSREEDMRAGRYRPMSAIRFKAGLGADGKPVSYMNHSVTPSILSTANPAVVATGMDRTSTDGLIELAYDIPNQHALHTMRNTHLPAWFWRSVGKSQNVFAIESFIDELAVAAKADPLDYRRSLIKSDREDMRRVLDMLREKGEWGRKLPAGAAQGIAIHEVVGTVCAQLAEVYVSKAGIVRVERIVSVLDPGYLVNPLTAEEQVESSIVWALSAALYGKLTVENGVVQETNFDRYPLLRLADAPVMETHFSLSKAGKWGGIGEAPVPTVAPALANAVFRATGKRMRSLPLREHNLAWG